MSGEKIAFWSAIAQIAPVLLLTFTLEFRYIVNIPVAPRLMKALWLIGTMLVYVALGVSLMSLQDGVSFPLIETFTWVVMLVAAYALLFPALVEVNWMQALRERGIPVDDLRFPSLEQSARAETATARPVRAAIPRRSSSARDATRPLAGRRKSPAASTR